MHDPEVYEDPDAFRPERFIRDGRLDFSAAPDPAKFVFGFGRRYGAGTNCLNLHPCSRAVSAGCVQVGTLRRMDSLSTSHRLCTSST